MKKTIIREGIKCPRCGSDENQKLYGRNRSGTQRCRCKSCNIGYTVDPKRHAYSKELRKIAIKEYMMGTSGRGVGKIHGMSGNNVVRWIKELKKTEWAVDKPQNEL